jgi:hypothetical protein
MSRKNRIGGTNIIAKKSSTEKLNSNASKIIITTKITLKKTQINKKGENPL